MLEISAVKIHNITVDKEIIFKFVLIAWISIWLLFLVRGLAKGEFAEYKGLFGKTLEEKRAYVAGTEFYEFIYFCNRNIPEGADYKLVADYDDSMDYYRFAYYVYPRARNLYSPEYIICYKSRFARRGYKRIAILARDKYILRRMEKR